jgi:hypothetical protein
MSVTMKDVRSPEGSGERWTAPSLSYIGGVGDLMRAAGGTQPEDDENGVFQLFEEEDD